ncbi:hypothetical protein [Endozoicomonas numazuensis]|nr:hypothetical protein [Endozoicomonas numazuensis]
MDKQMAGFVVPESNERAAIISAMYQFGTEGIPTTLNLLKSDAGLIQ